MNKRELKDKIIEESHDLKYIYDNYVPYEKILVAEDVLNLIDQLDELEKVFVPAFVGEWIEYEKKEGLFNPTDIRGLIRGRGFPKDYKIRDWFSENKQNEITFMRAWLDGYTVTKEKTYRVKLPDNESKSTTNILALRRTQDGRIVINQVSETAFIENENSFLTEDEIKRNHEYLWGFREEVEE